MQYALIIASFFWVALAFFGTRKLFMYGRGPICELIGNFKKNAPMLFKGGAGVLLACSVLLMALECFNLQKGGGTVGGYYGLGVFCGVVGAIMLSGQFFLNVNEPLDQNRSPLHH